MLLAGDKLSEAEAILKQITIAPGAPMADLALLRLGYVYGKQGKGKEAAAQYDKLLSQFTDSQHARPAALAFGQLKLQENSFDLAIGALRKAGQGSDDARQPIFHKQADDDCANDAGGKASLHALGFSRNHGGNSTHREGGNGNPECWSADGKFHGR